MRGGRGGGELGPAAREWVISSAGLTRLVLTFAVRDAKASPSGKAVTALGWIYVRNLLRILRPLLPVGNFEVLDNPLGVPPVPRRVPQAPIYPREVELGRARAW